MQPQTSSLSRDALEAADALILGDGTAAGLVIVHRSLLSQICAQSRNVATSKPEDQLGLLLGPESQNNDVLVEEAIPLGDEYRFARSLERLGSGIDSVQPLLAEARHEQSQTIVGLYRVLKPGQDDAVESSLEFLGGQGASSLSNFRCCFVLVPLTPSETLLRAFLRQGEHWDQIQEATLESVPSSQHPELGPSVARLNKAEQPRMSGMSATILDNVRRVDRFWVDLTILSLLLLLLTASTVLIWVVKQTPREIMSMQSLRGQIAELTAAVSKLQSPAAAPVPLEASDSRPVPKPNAPPKQISSPQRDPGKMAIAKKPPMLKPSEIFQFKVTGNPTPVVVWSSEGPGSIDPVHGLYKAPDQFTGETKVRIIATSSKTAQSVTFTLRGATKE